MIVERRSPARQVYLRAAVMCLLLVALLTVGAIALSTGAVKISLYRIAATLFTNSDAGPVAREHLILLSIRLPRLLMASSVGALLAAAGTIMQGLFRNPLADPGLVGVSAGAGVAVAAALVVGDRALPSSIAYAPILLPAAAFLGALITTGVLYRLSTWQGHTSVATMLLAGLALGAIAGAGTGLLIYLADDRQLRDVTFWMLGSLAGATWPKVAGLLPFLVILLASFAFIARGLDLLVLGETEAFHMGIPVERLKRILIVLVAGAAGAAVSVSGVIGFVGIIVPHILRLVIGPGHRLLLPATACFGAVLLLAADTLARTMVAPAELPIGILTSILGAPFFLFLLLKERSWLVL
jgi:iron complex transport system permease protein